MNAFISYSHNDAGMLDILHKHLAQLQREGLIKTWEDREIQVGDSLDFQISKALESSNLFLALLSPDYIASRYCYEKEFDRALQMQENDCLVIVPIILEHCDWLNTPFSKFKAVPKDGKPISTWENKNTAFLDVTQNLRRLVQSSSGEEVRKHKVSVPVSRNYRVQKDFDSIEKLEFLEKTFHEIKDLVKRFIEEITQLDNIKARILQEDDSVFKAMLVNRNKIATEAELIITTLESNQRIGFQQTEEKQISYRIGNSTHPTQKAYKLTYDEYQLYWTENNFYSSHAAKTKLSSNEIADAIWNEWLKSVGII